MVNGSQDNNTTRARVTQSTNPVQEPQDGDDEDYDVNLLNHFDNRKKREYFV